MYLEHGQSPPQQLSWQQQMVQTQLRRQEQQIIQLRTMQARGLNDYVPPPVYHTINNPVVHSFNYTNPFPAAPRINAGVTSVPNNLTMLVNNANIQPAPALSNNNSIVKNTPIMQNTQLQAPLLNSVVLPQQTLSSTTYNLSPTYDQHINATNTALHLSTSSALANNNANIHQLDGNSAGSNIVAPYLNINKPILSSSIGGGGISSSSPIIDNSKTESFSLIEPKANNLGKLMSVETKKSMRKAWDSAIKKQKKLRAQYLRQNKRDVPTMSIYGGKKTSNFTSAFTRRTNIKPPVRNVGRGMMQPSNSSLRYVKKKRVKNTFKNVKQKRAKNTFKNVQKKRVNKKPRVASGPKVVPSFSSLRHVLCNPTTGVESTSPSLTSNGRGMFNDSNVQIMEKKKSTHAYMGNTSSDVDVNISDGGTRGMFNVTNVHITKKKTSRHFVDNNYNKKDDNSFVSHNENEMMMGESETDGIVPYGNSTVYRDGDDFYNIEEILDKPPGSNSTNANPVDNDGNGNDGIVFAIDDDLDEMINYQNPLKKDTCAPLPPPASTSTLELPMLQLSSDVDNDKNKSDKIQVNAPRSSGYQSDKPPPVPPPVVPEIPVKLNAQKLKKKRDAEKIYQKMKEKNKKKYGRRTIHIREHEANNHDGRFVDWDIGYVKAKTGGYPPADEKIVNKDYNPQTDWDKDHALKHCLYYTNPSWSKEEILFLINSVNKGVTFHEISDALPTKSKQACQVKTRRMIEKDRRMFARSFDDLGFFDSMVRNSPAIYIRRGPQASKRPLQNGTSRSSGSSSSRNNINKNDLQNTDQCITVNNRKYRKVPVVKGKGFKTMNNRKFTENEPWAHFVSSTYGKLDLVLLSRIATQHWPLTDLKVLFNGAKNGTCILKLCEQLKRSPQALIVKLKRVKEKVPQMFGDTYEDNTSKQALSSDFNLPPSNNAFGKKSLEIDESNIIQNTRGNTKRKRKQVVSFNPTVYDKDVGDNGSSKVKYDNRPRKKSRSEILRQLEMPGTNSAASLPSRRVAIRAPTTTTTRTRTTTTTTTTTLTAADAVAARTRKMYCKRAQKEHAFRVQNMEAMSCYHYASEMVGMKLEKLVGKVVHARYRKASLDGYQEFYEAKVKRLNDDGTLKVKFKHSDGDIQQLRVLPCDIIECLRIIGVRDLQSNSVVIGNVVSVPYFYCGKRDNAFTGLYRAHIVRYNIPNRVIVVSYDNEDDHEERIPLEYVYALPHGEYSQGDPMNLKDSDLRFAVNAMWNLMQVKKIKYQTDRSVGLLMIARSVHKDSHLLLTKIESMNKENPNVISDYTCKFYTEQGKEEGVGPKSERLKAGTRIKVKLNEWKTWHRGYVDKVRGVKYDIDFDDGERRTNVKRNQIRVLGNGYSKKNNHVRKHVNDGADDLVNRKATRKPRWNDDISSDDEDIVYSSTERDATNLESDDEDNNIKTNRRSKGPDNSIWQNICRTEVQKVDDSILADLTYTNAWSLIDIRYLVNAARCHYHFNDVVKHLKKTPNSIFLKFRRMLKKVPTLSLKTLKAVLNEKHKVKYRIKNDWKKSQIQTLVKLRKEGKSFEEIGRILGKTYRLCYHKFKGLGKKYPKLKRYLFSLKRRKDKDEKMRTAKLNPTDEQLEETANYSWTVRQMKRMIAAIQNGHSFETCAATFKNPKRTTNAFKRKYERLVEKFGEIEED